MSDADKGRRYNTGDWTKEERDLLKELFFDRSLAWKDIVERLWRNEAACKRQADRMGFGKRPRKMKAPSNMNGGSPEVLIAGEWRRDRASGVMRWVED